MLNSSLNTNSPVGLETTFGSENRIPPWGSRGRTPPPRPMTRVQKVPRVGAAQSQNHSLASAAGPAIQEDADQEGDRRKADLKGIARAPTPIPYRDIGSDALMENSVAMNADE